MNKKDAVLESALTLFSKVGYNNVSMDEIARHARVAKGTLYYHFKDKKKLFENACDHFFMKFQKDVTAATASIPDPRKRFIAATVISMRYLLNKIDDIHIFLTGHIRSRKKGDPLIRKVLDTVEQGLLGIGISPEEAHNRTPVITSIVMTIFPASQSGFITDLEAYFASVEKTLVRILGD